MHLVSMRLKKFPINKTSSCVHKKLFQTIEVVKVEKQNSVAVNSKHFTPSERHRFVLDIKQKQ